MTQDISTIVSFLREQRKSVLEEWMQRRKENADREKVVLKSKKAWMDHLPKIFDLLLDSLALGQEDTEDTGDDHGNQRLQQGFDLAESILDLNLLESILHQRVSQLLASNNGKDLSSDSIHQASTTIATFLNDCVVETSYTHLRNEEEKYRRRELQLRNRVESLGSKLRENLKVVGASTHDLKGSTEVLVRLAENALQKRGEGPDPTALLEALTRGLVYNQRILEDLSVLSIDRPSGEPEEMSASAIIQSIASRTALSVGDPETRLIWETTDDISVRANRLSLERTIANLIDNAISHGDDSPISVGWLASPKKNQWTFEVENGVPRKIETSPETIGKWFAEPDFLNPGLGLSVVDRLVDSMRGELHFSLRPHNRLRIRVTLPRYIGGIVSSGELESHSPSR